MKCFQKICNKRINTKLYLLVAFLILFVSSARTQNSSNHLKIIDSIKHVIATTKQDTLKIKAWKAWDDLIYISDPDLDFQLNCKIDSLCKIKLLEKQAKVLKHFYLFEGATAQNIIGINLKLKGSYIKALEYFESANSIMTKLNSLKGMSATMNNLGDLHTNLGNYDKAAKYLTATLKILDKLNNKKGIGLAYGNIGLIYKEQNNFEKAIEYKMKSLKIMEEFEDINAIARCLSDIGNIYKDIAQAAEAKKDEKKKNENYEISMKYLRKSYNIAIKNNSSRNLMIVLNNIGLIYQARNDLDSAISLYATSLKLYTEYGDKTGIALTNNNLGETWFLKGDNSKALNYCSKSLKFAIEVGDMRYMSDASLNLYLIHKKTNNFKASIEMYEFYVKCRDSVLNEKNERAVIQQEYQYNYQKKVATDSIKNLELKRLKDLEIATKKTELKAQSYQQWITFGGIGLVLLFGLFIFNRFRVTRKQKTIIEDQKTFVEEQKMEIEMQKKIMEEKNREITDSIVYASRIQLALLPSEARIKRILKKK